MRVYVDSLGQILLVVHLSKRRSELTVTSGPHTHRHIDTHRHTHTHTDRRALAVSTSSGV